MSTSTECCVPTCPGPGKILYRFPIPEMESATIEEWVKRIANPWMQSLPEVRIYSKYRICDLHFANQCRAKDETRLRKGSLPTLFLPEFNNDCGVKEEEGHNLELDRKFNSVKIFDTKRREFKEVCRICFKAHEENNVVKLFGDECDGKEIGVIRDMIAEVLPDLDQGLYPNIVICLKCKEHLSVSYEFKKTWQSTEDKLRELVPEALNGGDLVLVEEEKKKPRRSDHNYAREFRETPPSDSYNENYFKLLQKQILQLGEGPHLCDVCGRFFTETDVFKTHVRRSHRNKPPQQICEICGVKCFSIHDLRRHTYRKHVRTYKCDVCNEVFKMRQQMLVHKKQKHCTTRYFQCHFCGKRIKIRKCFEIHLKNHETKEQLACYMCDKVFSKRNEWKKHVTWSHLRLKCRNCGKLFKQRRFLQMHLTECQAKE